MAIRVTQQTMYNNMLSGMQSNLGAYMESIQQGSTQKKINRPSDDPAGTYRVLTTRLDMTNTAQYQENVDTAKGWLNLADDVLSNQATVAIQGLTALAEQASTGTYTAEQRRIMADQARQYLGQLLNLSNTRFEGKTIFAGHQYADSAFEMGLGITSWDDNINNLWNNGDIKIEGGPRDETLLVQFTGNFNQDKMQVGTTFNWSRAGASGKGTVEESADGDMFELSIDGVKISIPEKAADNLKLKAANIDEGFGANNGTMFYVRPAVIYQGDDKDPPAKVTAMGGNGSQVEKLKAEGDFGKDVIVRFDTPPDTANDLKFQYSYSTDNGATWITPRYANMPADGKNLRLPVPGGYLEMNCEDAEYTDKDGNKLSHAIEPGTQIMIHPSRADLDYEIMKDTYLSVNSVGKDIFGGVYQGKPVGSDDDSEKTDNLFEVVGKFIGYLEGNNQDGCQKTLANLKTAEKKLLAESTRIGGLENRISMAEDVLSFQKLDQQERLSYTEDIDLTELLQKLTRQQISYQTVLQSSSMIMKLSLANYV